MIDFTGAATTTPWVRRHGRFAAACGAADRGRFFSAGDGRFVLRGTVR